MNSHRTRNYIVSAALVVAVFFHSSMFAQSSVTVKTPGTNFSVVGKEGTADDVAGGRRFRAPASADLKIRGSLRVPKSASGVSKTQLMQQLAIHFRTSPSGPSLRSVELLNGGSHREFLIRTDIEGDYTTRATSTPADSANMWKWTSPKRVDSQSVIVLEIHFPGGIDSKIDPGEFVLTSVDAQFQGEVRLNPNDETLPSAGTRSSGWVVAWGPNRLDIFGLDTNRQMIHQAYDGSWKPSQMDWEPHGGTFTSAPAVVAWAPNRLDIFGLDTNGQMVHQAWDGTNWKPSRTAWEPHGGRFSSPPVVVSWGPNRLDIFGVDTNGQMVHQAWNGSAWRPSQMDWEPLGGRFTCPPAVVAWGPNRLDIFGLDTNRQMIHKGWDGSWKPSQMDWEPHAGLFTSPPAVVAWSPNRLDIFGLDTNGQMVHQAWNGSAWKPSQTNWEPHGGVFTQPCP